MEKKKLLTATQTLLISIMIIIGIGTILLKMPISNNIREISWVDSFFTATSCVCVTGLTTIVTAEQFSVFGKVVLLVLIQIGGLGLMTFITLLLMALGRKINISDKLIIKELLNQNTSRGLLILIIRIFKYTIIIEGIGAMLLTIRFVPMFGINKGIAYSIFHSVSAFCNAGFDILGNNSLINYSKDYLLNIVIMLLIIIGGLGFTVWTDITRVIRKIVKKEIPLGKFIRELKIHTKIVLLVTILLLIIGTILFLILEFDNVYIMNNDTIGEKILKSTFYSTTLRTAGFTTISTNQLTTASKFISLWFMFIGGSPGSTAGGIKTVTFAVIVLMIYSFFVGKNETHIFKRTISSKLIKRSLVVFSISMFIIIISITALLITEDLKMEQSYHFESINSLGLTEIIYEVFSAFATVGITLGITTKLSIMGKIIISLLMIIGRLRTNYNITCNF